MSRGTLALLLAGVLLQARAAAASDPSLDLLQAVCCGNNRYAQAVDLYERLEQPAGKDHYLAGFALMRMNRMKEARSALRKAAKSGFPGYEGWPSTKELLNRIRRYFKFRPSLKRVKGVESIKVYARGSGAWSKALIAAVPSWESVGKQIFGEPLPQVDFVLFDDRAAFDEFYAAAFATSVSTSWQDATGSFGIVVACRESRGGVVKRRLDHPETVGNVFHEFGHAWMNTYVMTRHDKDWLGPRRSPMLDEGLSDYLSSVLDKEFFQRRRYWIIHEKVRRGIPPPPFDELLGPAAFYEKGDADLHYWLSGLLMERVLGPDKSLIPRIGDRWAAGDDEENAIKTLTGKSLRAEYDGLVKSFWTD